MTRVGTALAIAVSVAACSAGVSRFDFPAFSLGNDKDSVDTTASTNYSNREVPAPVYSYKPKDSRYGAGGQSHYGGGGYNESNVRKYSGNPASRPGVNNPEFRNPDARGSETRMGAANPGRVQRQTLAPPRDSYARKVPQYANQSTAAKPATSADGSRMTVLQGDTLYSISRRAGVSVDAMRAANGMTDNNIKIGQQLIVPGGGGAKPATRTAQLDSGATTIQTPVTTPAIKAPAPKAEAAKPVQKKPAKVAAVNPTPKATPGVNFRWPVRGRVLAKFGSKSDGSHNDGINVAVPRGTEVRAAESGVVAYAGSELKAYGKLILVRHANNWVSAYAHNDEVLVKRGDKIRRGQVISKAGTTGSVKQPQVHFELRKGSSPVDPLKYIAGL